MRAAIYVRISQDRAGLALGVDRQLDLCRELAASRGWTVVAEYIDNNLSARHGKRRPAYAELLGQVDAGEIDHVVVYMTSRLWRNPRERVDGIERFKRHRVAITPVRGPELDLASASGRMVAGILGELDTAESDVKAERQRDEVRQRAERGGYHGGPRAFGFTPNGAGLLADEADVVRGWYETIRRGGTIQSITMATGRRHSSVIAILRNPRNAGLRILGGQTFRAPNPPIVTEEVWRAVQVILDSPRRRRNESGSAIRWLGAGLYVCEACQRTVRTSYGGKAGSGYRTYACARVLGGCGRAWRADRVDVYIEDLVAARLARTDVADLYANPASTAAHDIATVRRRAAETRIKLDELGAAFGDGAIDAAQLRAGSRPLLDQLAYLEGKLAAAGQFDALAAIAAAGDPAGRWRRMCQAPARLEERRRIVAALLVVELLKPLPGRTPWMPERQIRTTWRTS